MLERWMGLAAPRKRCSLILPYHNEKKRAETPPRPLFLATTKTAQPSECRVQPPHPPSRVPIGKHIQKYLDTRKEFPIQSLASCCIRKKGCGISIFFIDIHRDRDPMPLISHPTPGAASRP